MYSARRIFIAGTDSFDNERHHADLDDLVSHSRHLNLASSPTLDVLSAETREKIRKLQQLQGWASVALERHDTDNLKTKQPQDAALQDEVVFFLDLVSALPF